MSYWPALTQAVESLQTALGTRLASIRVATNATLVRADRAAWLAEHEVRVTVGLDGLESAHDAHRTNNAQIGSWRRTAAGAAGLAEAGVVVDISMVVTADAVDRAAAGIDWICETYRPSTLLAVTAAPATLGAAANRPEPEHWAGLLVAAADRWHGAVRIEPVAQVRDAVAGGEPILHSEGGAWGGAIALDARGLAAPSLPLLAAGIGCVRLAEADLESGPFQQWRGRSPARRPECAGCPALGRCGNATMYDSAAVGGAPDALDPWHCRMQRKLVEFLQR
jgi:MoaA/NifB/PqqE/SkfB family radical SAM enzyme